MIPITRTDRYESFLNIADEEQARILETLLNQEQLYFPFHGDDFGQRFTKVIDHDAEQRTQLQALAAQALAHLQTIPPERRDFDRAKAEFQARFSLDHE